MEARIVIDTEPETAIDLCAQDLGNIVSSMVDRDTDAAVFNALSAHMASYVREQAACKDTISVATLNGLIADPSINVLRNVVYGLRVRQSATTEQLLLAIARDVEAAENIAQFVESYDNANDLGEFLSADKMSDGLA